MTTTNPIYRELAALLSKFGLSQEESNVLLMLYRHPHSPAGRIAEFAGLKRGYTYNILSHLCGGGFAKEIVERGVKKFSATDPLRLITRLEDKQHDLSALIKEVETSLPIFYNLAPSVSGLAKVQVYRGSEGLKELYEYTLNNKEGVIRAFADFAALFPKKKSPELNEWLWRYSSRRAKKKIEYRGIITRSKESDLAYQKRKAQRRSLKVLESGSFSVEINVFDDCIAILSTADEMMGVLIKSKPIADGMKVIFDSLWLLLPEYIPKV